MSTRSNIAIELEDKTILSVYCHSDGYISGVGKTLLENYNSFDKALKLIKMGGISSLGVNLNETSFYCRDWGRKEEKKPVKYNNEFCKMYEMTGSGMIEFIYLFKNNQWYVSSSEYISKNKLHKDAYDLGIAYWKNFKLVSEFRNELDYKPKMTEAEMVSSIGKMLKKSFGADNLVVQGVKAKTRKEVN